MDAADPPRRRGRPPKTAETPVARATREVTNRYDAAGYGRRLAGWRPPATGPRASVAGTTPMRDRARDAARNDWAGESGITKWATTIVGIGITTRFDRITALGRRRKVTDSFNDWCQCCDAEGVLSMGAMETLAVKTWFRDGEAFAILRSRKPTDRRPVPLVVQLLESDFCPFLDAQTWTGMPAGHEMRQGVEYNEDGERAAFWFYKRHPGDRTISGLAPTTADLVRIPAEEVCHIFEPQRAGQVRGASLLSSILVRLRNLGDFEDTALERQKLANLYVMFVTKQLPEDLDDAAIDTATGMPKVYSDDGTPLAVLSAGMTQELAPGEDVKFSNPPEAGTVYPDYIRSNHLGTSAGLNMPYEIFSGDIRGVSDRVLRIVLQEYRRLAQTRQWQVVIPMFKQRVVEAWGVAAMLVGVVRPGEWDAIQHCTHAPHGFEHIHPVQDPQGKLLEVQGGLRSRSSVISEQGDDPSQVDEERQADLEREESLGLPPTSAAAVTPPPKLGAGAANDPSADPTGDPAPAETAAAARVATMLAAVQPPQITNHFPAPRARSKVITRDPVTGFVSGVHEVELED